nr:venom polypeptide precursor [Doratifera vulnerans]
MLNIWKLLVLYIAFIAIPIHKSDPNCKSIKCRMFKIKPRILC